MKTHRCKELLKHECSIRYEKPGHWYKEDGWWLYIKDENWDTGWTGITPIKTINYCPWCGEKLED